MWLRKSCVLTLLLFFLFNASCAENVFKSTADETTDAALEIDAKRALNQKLWTVAIQKIQAMSAAKRAEKDTLFLLASAYGGQCGLAFVNFSSAFGAADFGSTSFFEFLLEHFVDSDVTNQAGCENAEATYDLITADLNTGDYLNKSYLAMAKIGSILNKSNGGNTWDGTSDTPCSVAWITDADVNQVMTGMTRFLSNAASAGLDTGSLPACGGCTKTDPATVTALERLALRTLLEVDMAGSDPDNDCST